ncbi:DUF4190 domain-containing protein [Cellulomonas sp. P22]|uniref:DUF4190 domain-containing protein n=1 Tax=Cellulomonas sp. P22 TaxID=3373189 RepID=UPI0037A4E67C
MSQQPPGYLPPPAGSDQHPPQPYPQGQPTPQHFPPAAPQSAPTNGLAVAALVVAIISLLLCFVPVINFASIVGGVVALVLGILGRRKAKSGAAGGKGLALAGVIIAPIAIVVAIIVNVVAGMAVDAINDSVQDAVADAENQESDLGSGLDEDEAAQAEQAALALGESATVGEYTVTVTAVNTSANEVLAAVNMYNEAPANQYVLVDLSVVYNGTDEGDPWVDLTASFVGTDARQYDASSCGAITPIPEMDVPTLNPTGTAAYNVCMDVPAEAITGGTVSLEETMSFTGEKVFWNIG